MKLKSLFYILLTTTLAFSITACDSDDENTSSNNENTPSNQSESFKVPDYKEGDACTDKLTPAFCDGNSLVLCQDSQLKKFACTHLEGMKNGVCLWAPDLKDLEETVLKGKNYATCAEKSELENNQNEDYQKCTEIGKITTVCKDDEEQGSSTTYYKCLETTQGLYSIYYNHKDCTGKCSDASSCAE